MRKVGFMLGFLVATLINATAQLTVEVALDQEQFLPNEPIQAAVRVTNRSGQTLQLGDRADWLQISVEGRDGYVVTKTEEVPVVGEFTLASSKVAIKRVNLTPYFNMTRPGRYAVVASVRIKEWNQEFLSQPKPFDIIDGRKLWEQEFGVPNSTGSGDGPEVRKFALQQANYLKQLKLYVRVSDVTDAKIFRVFALGPMVSFDQPTPQVDKTSRLHVLFQTGARSFQYCIVEPEGEVVSRQTYDYTSTRPALKMAEDGNIAISGGIRRKTISDLPLPSPEPVATNSPATNAP